MNEIYVIDDKTQYIVKIIKNLFIIIVGLYWLVPNDIYDYFLLFSIGNNPLNKYNGYFIGLNTINIFDFTLVILSILYIFFSRKKIIKVYMTIFVLIFAFWFFTWLLSVIQFKVMLFDSWVWYIKVIPLSLTMITLLSKDEIKFFFDFIFSFLTFSALIAYILDFIKQGYRLNTMGLDSNTSGIVFVSLIFITICDGIKNNNINIYSFIKIFCALIAIFLSGSRITLLAMIPVLGIALSNIFKSKKLKRTKYLFIAFSLFMLVVLCIIVFLLQNVFNMQRYLEIFNLLSSESYNGRLSSIVTGLKILKLYPFGVGNSDWLIQGLMQELGYPTFVHSTLLQGYLRFSFLFIILIVLFSLKLFKKLKTQHFEWYIYCLLFLLIRETLSYGLWNAKFSTIAFILILLLFDINLKVDIGEVNNGKYYLKRRIFA